MLDSLSFAAPADKVEPIRIRKDYSQQTFAKLRKASFRWPFFHTVIVYYGSGTRRDDVSLCGKRSDDASEVVEPFDELFRLELDVDPCDMCSLSSELSCVSLSNGKILVFNNKDDELVKVHEFPNVHGKGNSRVLCEFDSNTVISGSSNGSLAKIDIESGNITVISKGNSGTRSLCTLSGGTLLASGHSAGHVLIWDCRVAEPTKPTRCYGGSIQARRLDAVTTLANHPAQASLVRESFQWLSLCIACSAE
ncbi:hypothetical protein COOONC_01107 [Cooperia oncophora]